MRLKKHNPEASKINEQKSKKNVFFQNTKSLLKSISWKSFVGLQD